MDKYAQLAELLKSRKQAATPLFYAEVKAVDGDSCTIDYAGLEIDDVKLKATGADLDNKLLIIPKLGTRALVASLSGDFRELVLLRCDEPKQISYTYDDLEVLIDSTDAKVCVKNSDTSLIDLFASLKDVITNLTVATSTGPSGTPLPPTIEAVNQFYTDVQKLFK